MALPASGAISFSNINTELGAGATAQRSLNDAAVRALFGQASGAVDMNTGHGKSSGFNIVVSAETANLNIYNSAVALGWNGTTPAAFKITNNSTIYGSAAAAITGTSLPAGSTVEIINNGYIYGYGGAGGYYAGGVGTAGGHAIVIGGNTLTINNTNGYIFGGGGGGGSGGDYVSPTWFMYSGGGGGQGYVGGAAGTNYAYGNQGYGTYRNYSNPVAGSSSGPGAAGITYVTNNSSGAVMGYVYGGAGGGWGAAGGGAYYAGTYNYLTHTYAAGAGGYAVYNYGIGTTWAGGNNASQVKGSVG